MQEVIVIGGGVVGLTSAWWLLEAGYGVTLLEREAVVGSAASFRNGGQLSYRYVSPLADAGRAAEGARMAVPGKRPAALPSRSRPAPMALAGQLPRQLQRRRQPQDHRQAARTGRTVAPRDGRARNDDPARRILPGATPARWWCTAPRKCSTPRSPSPTRKTRARCCRRPNAWRANRRWPPRSRCSRAASSTRAKRWPTATPSARRSLRASSRIRVFAAS